MMNRFSSHSLAQLKSCDDRLQEIMNRAIKEYDFSILCGYRNEHDQNEAYDTGHSKLKWPKSMHNRFPSLAVDIAPYPINWSDSVAFCELSQIIKRIAEELMIPIVWGGDFAHFVDMPHWELK
jgi:peptidoglycan L-alanyl-D-glutamate endopeptidase CwlK